MHMGVGIKHDPFDTEPNALYLSTVYALMHIFSTQVAVSYYINIFPHYMSSPYNNVT